MHCIFLICLVFLQVFNFKPLPFLQAENAESLSYTQTHTLSCFDLLSAVSTCVQSEKERCFDSAAMALIASSSVIADWTIRNSHAGAPNHRRLAPSWVISRRVMSFSHLDPLIPASSSPSVLLCTHTRPEQLQDLWRFSG